MSRTILITTSDDRQGRKGGKYSETQDRIQGLLGDWIEQKHYRLPELINCDPLMANPDSGKNGRVYKPWAILDMLEQLENGDFLIYNDCSPELWPKEIDLERYDLDVIRRLTMESRGFLTGFVKWSPEFLGPDDLGIHTHENFTLDSCMVIMQAEQFRDAFLCASGMICIQKSHFTLGLVRQWLFYNRIPDCSCFNVSEHENSYWDGKPGRKLGNRHDQSVLSLILNRHGFSFCDIVYNDMNPYNFLNFCHSGHEYKFISSTRRSYVIG